MLHSTANTKTLLSESRSATTFVYQVIDCLRAITPEKEYASYVANLIKTIPEFKDIGLAKDAEEATQLLRKVCTKEVEVSDALVSFENALRELRELVVALDQMQFPRS